MKSVNSFKIKSGKKNFTDGIQSNFSQLISLIHFSLGIYLCAIYFNFLVQIQIFKMLG